MRIWKPSDTLISLILGLISIFAIYKLTIKHYPEKPSERKEITGFFMLTTLPDIDEKISDSVSHKEYLRLTDSIKYVRWLRNGHEGSGFSSGFFGVRTSKRCLTCTDGSDIEQMNDEYFLVLPYWLYDDGAPSGKNIWYMKGDQPLVRKVICTYNAKNERICKEQDLPVNFRVNSDNQLMIPVSDTVHQILWILTVGFAGLSAAFWLMYILGGFAKVLISIAIGKAFSEKNVWRLKLIAYSLGIYTFATFGINLSFKLIFARYFTTDIYLDPAQWNWFYGFSLLTVVFVALYAAFKKAKALKDIQDYTI